MYHMPANSKEARHTMTNHPALLPSTQDTTDW